MAKNDHGKRILLLEADTSSSAIAALYRYGKASQAKFSLAFVAKKSGITSTGYLSDVINGKRTLHVKYRQSIGAALGLDHNEAEYLTTLIDSEHARTEAEQLKFKKDLQRLKKLLQIDLYPVHFGRINLLFSVLLMSAFSLFKGKPRIEDLVHYFGKANATVIREHLAHLEKQKIVSHHEGHYQLDVPHLLFAKSDGEEKVPTFLRHSLLFAASKVEEQFADFENGNFTSTVIGVNKSKYQETLKKIKVELLKLQMQLENSDDADTLVYFNAQIFPVNAGDVKGLIEGE